MTGKIYMFNLYYLEFTKGIPWWSEFRLIFTHEGVLNQSQINDKLSLYNYNLFKKEYVMGRIQRK